MLARFKFLEAMLRSRDITPKYVPNPIRLGLVNRALLDVVIYIELLSSRYIFYY